VEPFELTSNGGGGVALLRRVKRGRATFYEVININMPDIRPVMATKTDCGRRLTTARIQKSTDSSILVLCCQFT
jgi:hypothetical protein